MAAGSVLMVVGALAVSSVVGVGVYVAIKEARTASAAEDAENRPGRPRPDEPDDEVATAPRPGKVAPPPDAAEELPTPAPDEPAAGRPPAPGEVLGSPGIAGGLEAEAVMATLREARGRLGQCEVVLGGRVDVTLEVNRRGGVTSTKVDAGDEALGACAAKVLAQVRFARTSDGKPATVVVPLAFERGAAPADTASQPDAPTREEIMTALRPDRRAVSTCAVTHNFEGTLKVKFTIAPEGTVSRVSIDDVEPALASCVSRVITRHTFSRTRNGATVSFPFTVPL